MSRNSAYVKKNHQRKRDQGYVRMDIWVKPEWKEDIKDFVAWLDEPDNPQTVKVVKEAVDKAQQKQ